MKSLTFILIVLTLIAIYVTEQTPLNITESMSLNESLMQVVDMEPDLFNNETEYKNKSLLMSNDTDDEVRKRINNWKPNDGGNIWELSGQMEGDIKIPHGRNGQINPFGFWTCGIIPYSFDVHAFNTGYANVIFTAMMEFQSKTCLRFRPRKFSDKDYIEFTSKGAGCWSLVGKQGGKQNVNLQSPQCFTHANVLHEIMHAIGFYHAESSANRNVYVKINWENIQPGQEYNFIGYTEKEVSDFGVPYDYKSIMHSSPTAFSKNGLPTIESRYPGQTFGNAEHLSDGDVEKIRRMYQRECEWQHQCRG